MSRGGKRENAGRKAGLVNQLTRDIREMALPHAEQAIDTIVGLMGDAEVDYSVRMSAAKEILDRAYGKAKQSVDANVNVSFAALVRKALEHGEE